MQVDPIKPTLKAPGTKRLKLRYDGPLSNVAFKFNLRRYTKGSAGAALRHTRSMMFGAAPAVTGAAAGARAEVAPEELESGRFTFLTVLFRYHNTVLPKILPQTLLVFAVSIGAQVLKIAWCGVGITSHTECSFVGQR